MCLSAVSAAAISPWYFAILTSFSFIFPSCLVNAFLATTLGSVSGSFGSYFHSARFVTACCLPDRSKSVIWSSIAVSKMFKLPIASVLAFKRWLASRSALSAAFNLLSASLCKLPFSVCNLSAATNSAVFAALLSTAVCAAVFSASAFSVAVFDFLTASSYKPGKLPFSVS